MLTPVVMFEFNKIDFVILTSLSYTVIVQEIFVSVFVYEILYMRFVFFQNRIFRNMISNQ